ncbi:MAG: ferrous iron transport protein A [Oligoflexales bacterium]|nr:ferrous iron transport protein A [Oligoflexales bacterium]
MKLSELPLECPAKIVGFVGQESKQQEGLLQSIVAMGLCPGCEVTIKHVGPFGKNPIAVSCRGSLIGIGLEESEVIEVERKYP